MERCDALVVGEGPAGSSCARVLTAAGCVLQPITGFRTGVLRRRAVETRYGEIVSYGIRRCEFDHFLLDRCGAKVRTGVAVRSLRRDGDDWVVNETYRAPVVVGAGGHFCPVAKFVAGAKSGAGARVPEPVVAAQEVEFLMDPSESAACGIRGDTPEFHFCADLEGYAWCFRKGDYLNVGLGRRDARALPAHVSDFLDEL